MRSHVAHKTSRSCQSSWKWESDLQIQYTDSQPFSFLCIIILFAPLYHGNSLKLKIRKNSLSRFVLRFKVVEDGYEFFAKRQLVTLFSAPNYCGEFDNAGGMMSVDETLMCSFQVTRNSTCLSWSFYTLS